MMQTRWTCRDCGREWVEAAHASLDPKSLAQGIRRPWTPDLGCFAPDCTGEVKHIRFDGLFDSTTPPDLFARAFAGELAPVPDAAATPLVLLAAPELEQDWIGLVEGRW